MTKYERAKQFYSRATFALSDFLHGRIDELEFKKEEKCDFLGNEGKYKALELFKKYNTGLGR